MVRALLLRGRQRAGEVVERNVSDKEQNVVLGGAHEKDLYLRARMANRRAGAAVTKRSGGRLAVEGGVGTGDASTASSTAAAEVITRGVLAVRIGAAASSATAAGAQRGR